MRRMLPIGVMLILCHASALSADDRARTAVLPGALASLGVGTSSVLSTDQAHRVRGAGGCVPPPPAPRPCGTYQCSPPPPQPPSNCPPPNCSPCGSGSTQSTTFVVSGAAVSGQAVLMEGVVGQFQYTKSDGAGGGTVIQGTFGGLSGNLGVDPGGNLSFSLAGKAVQETLNFSGGQFVQIFTQTYRH